MKKTTFLLSLLCIGGSVIGQQFKQAMVLPTVGTASSYEPKGPVKKGTSALSAATFFSEDFASGIPATWNNGGTPAAAIWEYRPDTTSILGSRGAYSGNGVGGTSKGGTSFISSPTNYNGYVIFDSDYYDNAGVAGDFGKGPAPAPHKGILSTAPINCSGHPSVILQFNQYKRYYAGITTVTVDNGVTKNTYTLNSSLAVNSRTARNSVITLNITPEAANQSNVVISFTFDGTAGTQPGYYFWMIDDVKLIDSPANDLVLEDDGISFNGPALAALPGSNRRKYGYYTMTPVAHQVDTLAFDGEVLNAGSADQSSVKLTVDIVRGTDPVFNKSYNYAKGNPLPSLKFGGNIKDSRDSVFTLGENLRVPFPGIFLPGKYTATLNVSSTATENDPSNNSRVHTFATTDTTFARDNGQISFLSSTADNPAGNGTDQDGFGAANLYEMNRNDAVSSISIYLASGTTAGAKIKGQLFLGDLKTLKTETAEYIVTDQDTGGKFVTIPYYTDGVIEQVQKDSVYYAAVYTFSTSATPGQKVIYADDNTIIQPTGASLIHLPGGTLNAAAWYNNGNAYIIRLNTVLNLASTPVAAKGKFSVGQNVPNPFGKTSVINYTLDKSSVVSLQVFDVTGRLVTEQNEGVKTAGNYSFTLNAANFNKGIYFYTVKAGENSVTKKMVITE